VRLMQSSRRTQAAAAAAPKAAATAQAAAKAAARAAKAEAKAALAHESSPKSSRTQPTEAARNSCPKTARRSRRKSLSGRPHNAPSQPRQILRSAGRFGARCIF